MAYSISGWNNEPDGRLVLQVMENGKMDATTSLERIVIPVGVIDDLIEMLTEHSGSEGDGKQFIIQR